MTIFVPPKDIASKEGIKLNADKSHYLISVLRCKKGDVITIFDGKGKAYEAEIVDISKKHAFIDILNEAVRDTESALNIILCQGILKGEKMDMVIQKATELGVKEIIPLITERCIVKETKKVKRWQKIAEESAEQCGRTIIPTVHEYIEFKEFFKNQGKINGFMFWEEGGIPLKEAVFKISPSSIRPIANLSIYLFVGPEGGFAAEEVKLSEEHGLITTTLGKRIFRAETAAIISAALVQFLLES